MATPAGSFKAKHCILAAFVAGFIAAAVVIIVFVVLSPARINFSVTSAGSHDLGDGGVQLNLTISANNTSRRAAVLYKSMYVDVSNNTEPQWVSWVRADVPDKLLPLRQPVLNVTEIHASPSVLLVAGRRYAEDFTGNKRSHSFSVRVTAVARFKVGIAWTRLYGIKVLCFPVDFFAINSSSIVHCSAA